MSIKLYVSNLPFSVSKQGLMDSFGACGTVESVDLVLDQKTGHSKGVAFIQMATESEAQAAVRRLHSTVLDGRQIYVSEVVPLGPKRIRSSLRRGSHRSGW